MTVELLLREVRQCRLCEPHLPLGANPVLQLSASSKILVAGQAPGTKVHETGLPFNDQSGDRLRRWMGLARSTFYDETQLAIVPMGFCYPGRGRSGDLPPRPECAEMWRRKILASLENIQLTLVIGQYAFRYHMPERKGSLTENVKYWDEGGATTILLPHPSPRNNIWLKKNPWFEESLVPKLQERVSAVLS